MSVLQNGIEEIPNEFEGDTLMISYVIYYTNGAQRVKHFEDKWQLADFLHDEGDHVKTTKRFFSDEQEESDYDKDMGVR